MEREQKKIWLDTKALNSTISVEELETWISEQKNKGASSIQVSEYEGDVEFCAYCTRLETEEEAINREERKKGRQVRIAYYPRETVHMKQKLF